MIIFDLICAQDHVFEGWFSSSDDYEQQKSRNILCCPSCGSNKINKAMMAPNIGMKSNQKSNAPVSTTEKVSEQTAQAMKNEAGQRAEPNSEASLEAGTEANSDKDQLINSKVIEAAAKELAKIQQSVLKDSTWVGGKFADEARSIYYGEADKRQIHGHATANEASELKEEGIDIAALPIPFIPPDLKN